ncbi:hypothetical protein LCGC14_0273130 [marine sediment metagenome]|uniref:Uncharacterized protein n=2 Tax=root TaxID=1 RepID=A0A9C9TG42_9HYPH|nr:hypothetical protein [Aurantimonas coralicida]
MGHEFDAFHSFHARLLEVADGDIEEAKLLLRAKRRAGNDARGLNLDNLTINHFRHSLTFGRSGNIFRDAQLLNDQELQMNARRLAFGGPPARVREEHSQFCLLMFQGYQIRFLDRHPGETPEAFANRPRKTAVNITRVIINALSKLYAKRPARKLVESTSEQVKLALVGNQEAGVEGIWSDAYDLELLEADRYTRLEGTTSVRPFFDRDHPGNIKLVVFHSHQLRIIPNPAKPWKPLAVIERHKPFESEGAVIIWTAKSFLQLNSDGSVDPSSGQHTMGRIPHTFFLDRKAATGSFFVEGRGRGLCDANAVINAKLTDLNEVYQYQGFAVPEIVNWDEEEDLTLGPRRPVHFKDIQGDQPFGIEFKAPPPMLKELRAEVNADIEQQFRANNVPPSATGAEINRRSLSGRSIQESMRPLLEDLQERARLFSPFDVDLADNALSVRAEHDDDFNYEREKEKPRYHIDYQEPDFPLGTDDRVKSESHDLAHAIRTEPEIMMERDPDRFPTIEDAQKEHQANLAYQRQNPLVQDGSATEVEGEDFLESLLKDHPLAEGDLTWVREELAALQAQAEADETGSSKAKPKANGNGDLLGELARGKVKA